MCANNLHSINVENRERSSCKPEAYLHKVFNDPVHGHISLHPLCVKIIDTPEFQRLRFIKQLGPVYLVYPGAAHNRFEHSLGVCYLSGRIIKTLQKRQPELNISDEEVLCVMIAGLCHDLGHGPLSHLFDQRFIPSVCPDITWKHEEASVTMFDYMITENHLEGEFEKYNINKEKRHFIKKLIECKPEKNSDESKGYFYEIVCNKRNGIDADRWDYCTRDCLLLGIRTNFDHKRCMKFVRVIEVKEINKTERQLCFRDKENGDFYDLFYLRAKLHRQAYQHKTTFIIGEMIVQALIKADEHLKFEGQGGIMKKMSEAIGDMKVLSALTDEIFNVILNSSAPELKEPKELLHKVVSRELPKCVDEIHLEYIWVAAETISELKKAMKIGDTEYRIQIASLDFGMGTDNPIENIRFYSKHNLNNASRDKTKVFPPVRFKEEIIRVFSTKRDHQSCKRVKEAFRAAIQQIKERMMNPVEVTANRVIYQRVKATEEEGLHGGSGHLQDVGLSELAASGLGSGAPNLGPAHTDKLPELDPQNYKVFNDPVHGHISMHPLCVKIIDTPEFQRLRRIKQIGAVYFVYPGASHNRFEHSLGVCYLAGRTVKKLRKQQPDLGITDEDELCVQIAGLCHDLGHGPFSSLFEERFVQEMQSNCNWTHKVAAIQMFSHLIKENKLEPEFVTYGLTDDDIEFIKELLNVKSDNQDAEWKYKGRTDSKRFLYEIVTNVRNGIDADTWDSCARDCLMLGMISRFDHKRCIKYIRAIKVNNRYQICFRDKEKRDLDELFFIQAKLKDMAYQHKTTFIAGEMIVEALRKVNALIMFKGTDGTDKTLFEAKDDMNAFCALTDDVITQILNLPYPKREELEHLRSTQEPDPSRIQILVEGETTWKEARKLLQNVLLRKLYKFVAEIKPPSVEEFKSQLDTKIAERGLSSNDIMCQFVEVDYTPNVWNTVAFYSKHEPDFATVQLRVSKSHLKEHIFRVFCKNEQHFATLKEITQDLKQQLPR
ncbi:uncharacterized protein LOC127844452 isoform X2 [Dreissena polymorpha]|uniref:uncharacterized protein LOC127844452 isoform X2 n=1 Tax=Dreissena polymorpha TaxID=45954 RepID=UPI0022650639|nr:uncharacterized protein LOC127844452 isoform X2 [Dreissena polymorpha]